MGLRGCYGRAMRVVLAGLEGSWFVDFGFQVCWSGEAQWIYGSFSNYPGGQCCFF